MLGFLVVRVTVVSPLFLTSKVRLHCDRSGPTADKTSRPPFPDLKGQAPLRLDQARDVTSMTSGPFPDLKGQAPLRRHGVSPVRRRSSAFS